MHVLNKNTDYAVRALVYLASKREKVVPASQLAKVERIPKPFLRRILQTLSQKRIVASLRGKAGGFYLNREPSQITLLAIFQVFQGEMKMGRCIFRKSYCRNYRQCVLRKKLEEIEKITTASLSNITIASLLEFARRG